MLRSVSRTARRLSAVRSLTLAASQKRTQFTVTNPATEEVVRHFDEDDFEQVEEKFEKAKRAQKKWSGVALQERINIIKKFSSLILQPETVQRLATITATETGKPISQAESEIKALGPRIQFFTDNVAQAMQEETVLINSNNNSREKITYEPVGVVGNVSAWNYPYFVGTNVFIPALLTGNAVLYKPSEHATLTGLGMSELLHEAGVPKDVFVPFVGSARVGAEIVAQPLDAIFFTGSYGTGEKINKMAATHMMKVQLELGGKDATYVTDNLSGNNSSDAAAIQRAAASLADGAMYNTGQSCCSVERIYIHASIYDKFVAAFVEAVDAMKMGSPLDRSTYLGPLTRPQQRAFLLEQVKDALEKGATLLRGGSVASVNGKGSYFAATVLANVDNTMSVMREESFGPIIGLMKVDSDEQAVQLMNDSSYGLTAGVYCADVARASALLSRVEAGTVYVNKCDSVSPRLPWSGRKHSGVGVTLSMQGIKCFLQPKAWNINEKL